MPLRIWILMTSSLNSSKTGSPTSRKLTKPLKRRRDEVAQVVKALGANGHAPGFEPSGGELPLPYHQMRYWMLGLVLSSGIILPGEVDRCLTGPGRIIPDVEALPKSVDWRKKGAVAMSGTRALADESEMVTISGHQDVLRNDEKNLLKALAHQPLSVAIDASGREFQFYRGVTDAGFNTSLSQDAIKLPETLLILFNNDR
ncbi:hypothetical protein Rs2_01829 [Raphanus sativus]|nr:hypothetical protein Rs2_01829 [Raphanus sativus]